MLEMLEPTQRRTIASAIMGRLGLPTASTGNDAIGPVGDAATRIGELQADPGLRSVFGDQLEKARPTELFGEALDRVGTNAELSDEDLAALQQYMQSRARLDPEYQPDRLHTGILAQSRRLELCLTSWPVANSLLANYCARSLKMASGYGEMPLRTQLRRFQVGKRASACRGDRPNEPLSAVVCVSAVWQSLFSPLIAMSLESIGGRRHARTLKIILDTTGSNDVFQFREDLRVDVLDRHVAVEKAEKLARSHLGVTFVVRDATVLAFTKRMRSATCLMHMRSADTFATKCLRPPKSIGCFDSSNAK